MGPLEWNHRKVQRLSPGELWMFIVGRVLAGLGLGILLAEHLPDIAAKLGVPALVLGFLLLIYASKGMFRKNGRG